MRTSEYIKPEAWVKIAEAIANKNGGKLPNPQRLIQGRKNGWALYQAMRRNRGLFKHIQQESLISRSR